MEEEKYIVNDKKIYYILFAIGFAISFITVSLNINASFLNRLILSLESIKSDFLIQSSLAINKINILLNIIEIAGVILCFISARKLLINRCFTIISFILLLISKTLLLFFSLSNFFNKILFIINIIEFIVLILILLICIKNKILNNLILISIIFISINSTVNVFNPLITNIINNLSLTSFRTFSLSTIVIIYSYFKLITSLLSYVGYILIIVYIIKCFIKNNIFKTIRANVWISLLIMVGPAVLFNSIVSLVYLICALIV